MELKCLPHGSHPGFHVLTEKFTNSDEMFDALKINAEKDVNENCNN